MIYIVVVLIVIGCIFLLVCLEDLKWEIHKLKVNLELTRQRVTFLENNVTEIYQKLNGITARLNESSKYDTPHPLDFKPFKFGGME